MIIQKFHSVKIKLICCLLIPFVTFIFFIEPTLAKNNLSTIPCHWTPIGPGGGGGMFYPTFSPSVKDGLMTLSCDMGGTYRSLDNGQHWQMMDFGLQGINRGLIGYDPTNKDILYATRYRRLWKTEDGGITWKSIASIKGLGNGNIIVDPANPKKIWVPITLQAVTPIFSSVDRGRSWNKSSQGIPDRTEVRNLFLDLSSPTSERHLFAATNTGFYFSQNNGSTWVKKIALSNANFLDFKGTMLPSRQNTFFGIVKNKGVYRSEDEGNSWEQMNNGLPQNGSTSRLLAVAKTDPNILYTVCGKGQIYRSGNAGKKWTLIYNAMKGAVENGWVTHDLGAAWAGNIRGIAVNPFNANDIIFTDYMRACRSTDGGRTWKALYTNRTDNGWTTTGLDVTTTYKLVFNPQNPNHQFISNGDIGLIQSIDNGKSWQRTVSGVPFRWRNTIYNIAIDPKNPDYIWGAFSRLHDMPHRSWHSDGGICFSKDGGKNWKPFKELPKAQGTSILVDPSSNPKSRTLYAGLFTSGVYKSEDGGKTWVNKSRGLPDQPAVWHLAMYNSQTLLCVVTRSRRTPGGIYLSTDGAETWQPLKNENAFDFPLDAAFDPRNAKTIYATSFGKWKDKNGGLYKTVDGGRTWEHLLTDNQIWGVTIDPNNPDIVYACCMSTGSGGTRGVLRSLDAGRSWKQLTGLPFYSLHSVTVDPRNSQTIYVTTFGGGVWKTTTPRN